MNVYVRQSTKFSCAAAVVSMITGQSIERVFEFLGHRCEQRGMRWFEIIFFISSHGYHLGAFSRGIDVGRRMVKMEWPRNIPAYLIVESASGENNHAVYWDGEIVLDPEPANFGKKLERYKVKEWWPVIKIESASNDNQDLVNEWYRDEQNAEKQWRRIGPAFDPWAHRG